MILLIHAEAPAVGISMSTAQIVVGVLGALGLGSVLAAVVTGFFSRKKLGADATEIITKAAAGVVERTELDNARLRRELAAERQEREADRAEFQQLIYAHERVLQLHAAWDHMAKLKLEEAGITGLPEPPPIYAPDGSPNRLRGTLER